MSKINYATKVENGGTTTAGRLSAADANEIKTSVNVLYDEVPYKSYVAQITQIGTSNPTLTVLQNTTGLTFVATRVGVGSYLVTPNTPPSDSKTAYFGGTREIGLFYDGDNLQVSTVVSGSPADASLFKNSIEFRIYP